jgi:hypothetical protein
MAYDTILTWCNICERMTWDALINRGHVSATTTHVIWRNRSLWNVCVPYPGADSHYHTQTTWKLRTGGVLADKTQFKICRLCAKKNPPPYLSSMRPTKGLMVHQLSWQSCKVYSKDPAHKWLSMISCRTNTALVPSVCWYQLVVGWPQTTWHWH